MALTDFKFEAQISRKLEINVLYVFMRSFTTWREGEFCRESVTKRGETKLWACCLYRADRTGAIRLQI